MDPTACPLLSLPVEVRLQIYNLIYRNPTNAKYEPAFFLRDDTTILQPLTRWFKHEGPSLLLTCSKVHREALQTLYDHANCRVTVLIGDGWPRYAPAGPLNASNPLIKNMRHVEVMVHLSNEEHLGPSFARLKLFARALEESRADLKTLKVTFRAVTSYLMAVTWDLVVRKREEVLNGLGEQECALFRRMLVESGIVSVR